MGLYGHVAGLWLCSMWIICPNFEVKQLILDMKWIEVDYIWTEDHLRALTYAKLQKNYLISNRFYPLHSRGIKVKFPLHLTRNITSHSIKNLASYSFNTQVKDD